MRLKFLFMQDQEQISVDQDSFTGDLKVVTSSEPTTIECGDNESRCLIQRTDPGDDEMDGFTTEIQANSSSSDTTVSWVDRFIAYADARCPMTPKEFHEAIGLWLISTGISRRLVACMPHDNVYPNLWMMLIAPSTLYAKSTAFNIADNMAREAFPHLMFPNSSTPEAMIQTLSGSNLKGDARNQAGQKGLLIDEASGLLAHAGRDYMAGTVELFMKLFDCPSTYERVTKGDGLVRVNGAYITFLAASTPAMLAPHMKSPLMWSNGWWPRFGIVPSPEGWLPYRKARAVDPGIVDSLISDLVTLHQRLPMPVYPSIPEPLAVDFAEGVTQAYDAFVKHWRYDLLIQNAGMPDSLYAAYGRVPSQALKVAMCLAAMDWSADLPVPVVEMRHWQRAVTIAESWLAGSTRSLEMAHKQRLDGNIESVRNELLRSDTWHFMRDICRSTGLKGSIAESALLELRAMGEAELEHCTRGNQQTIRARAITGDQEQSPVVADVP